MFHFWRVRYPKYRGTHLSSLWQEIMLSMSIPVEELRFLAWLGMSIGHFEESGSDKKRGGRVTCVNPLASIWDGALHLPASAIMHSPFCDLQQDPKASMPYSFTWYSGSSISFVSSKFLSSHGRFCRANVPTKYSILKAMNWFRVCPNSSDVRKRSILCLCKGEWMGTDSSPRWSIVIYLFTYASEPNSPPSFPGYLPLWLHMVFYISSPEISEEGFSV